MLGFSIGGICKRFLVAPPSMIWPANLTMATLFNTLHAQETSGSCIRGGISRLRFFCYVFVGYFFYSQFFFPSETGPSTAVLICYCRRFSSLLSIHCSLKLLMGLLDSSSRCQDQPTLRRHPWLVHGHSHLRLGSNHSLKRLPSLHPLVGYGQHWRHYRAFILVPPPHPLREVTFFSSYLIF